MIAQTVQSALEKMKQRWGKVLSVSPHYLLDDTWPAVGTLDALTFLLRRQDQLDDIAQELLKGAAASIAIITHDCWKNFGADVTVDELEEGIAIVATGGPNLQAGDRVVAHVERDIKSILLESPKEFVVVPDLTRHVNPQGNYLSLYAMGLATGLSSFAEGPWRDETFETFHQSVGMSVRTLAQQSADHYAAIFPDEPLGQVPELYLRGLVFPPMLYQEDYPARRAVKSLLTFCDEYKVPQPKILRLAFNLALSPDEQISAAGLATYAAMIDKPTPEFLALCDTKGAFLGVLRPAMLDAREMLKLDRDWMLADEMTSERKKRVELEMRLGFFPWLKMNKEKVFLNPQDAEIQALIRALTYFNLNEARSVCDRIIELTPNDIQVRIQRIYLDVIAGDPAKAETGLKNLLTEPEAENVPAVLNLMGLVQLVLGNVKNAVFHLGSARNYAASDQALSGDIANNYAWAEMCSENFETALDALDIALQRNPLNLVAMLNKRSVLIDLGKFEEAERVLAELVRVTPFDRRVFTGVMQGLLIQPNDIK